MPHLTTDDGVKLYYEEVGSGIPIVFVHEFAGDVRSWEPQLRYFGRRYRCIAFNARGYPPSDVPGSVDKYSQDRARDDIRAVLDALKIDKAHIIGLSMGGFATVHFGFTYPGRALSLVIAGCGYGASPDKRTQFLRETEVVAARFETEFDQTAATYALAKSLEAAKARSDQTIYLRIDSSTLAIVDMVADQESRSRSKQVEYILKQFVREVRAAG